jgi:tetratricopeptide (TPR) repeat protein
MTIVVRRNVGARGEDIKASTMAAQPEIDAAVALLTSEECVLTLAKVLDNILTETCYEKKTRKLKLTNETFSRRVARHPGGLDFLLGCSFARKNQTLVLKRDNEDKMWLWDARNALHKRSLVLGFALPPMPPAPTQHRLSEGKKYHESASLYETSTIGTMDELDVEIMKELEDEAGLSPKSPAPWKSQDLTVSPLATPKLAAADRLLGAPDQSSLAVPILPSKSPERPKGLPPKPPNPPRSPLKSAPPPLAPPAVVRSPPLAAAVTTETAVAIDPLLAEMEEELESDSKPVSEEDLLLKEMEAELNDDVVLKDGGDESMTPDLNMAATHQETIGTTHQETIETSLDLAHAPHTDKEFEFQSKMSTVPPDDVDPLMAEMEAELGNHADAPIETKHAVVADLKEERTEEMDGWSDQESTHEPAPSHVQHMLDLGLSDGLSPPSTVEDASGNIQPETSRILQSDSRPTEMEAEIATKDDEPSKVKNVSSTSVDVVKAGMNPKVTISNDPVAIQSAQLPALIGEMDCEMDEVLVTSNEQPLQTESSPLPEANVDDLESEMDALLGIKLPPIAVVDSYSIGLELGNGLSSPSTVTEKKADDVEQEMCAFPSKQSEEMADVFGSSTSSFNITAVHDDGDKTPNPQDDNALDPTAGPQIGVNVRPPPLSKSQDGLNEFFNGTESAAPLSYHDSDDELPTRTVLPRSSSGDDLEKEMASLLAQSTEIPLGDHSPQPAPAPVVGRVQELDDSFHSKGQQSVHEVTPDDVSIAEKSIPDQIQQARTSDLDNGPSEDVNYSSVHAHTDWLKLNELMKHSSMLAEYEVCWGSLCTLSVVCADLPTEELGLSPPNTNKSKNRKNRSKRSWLPLELVQGLWNLALSTENSADSARVAYVCSKLHDVLVESDYLEVLDRDESGASLPHSHWVRVKKEKMVLLGFALPISISQQSMWMRKLAKAIVDDTHFWYGRYALPTIAIAGGDKEAKAKSLLRDVDFVQSRLDVIGIVTGTRRHVLDCKSFIKAKKQAFKDKQFRSEEFKIAIAEENGHDVALDGCQQVATCLYKQGQVFSSSNAPVVHMIELAAALHIIGMAVGEFGDWEMEMQLYQKTIKVLQDCEGYNSECAADTLLSMGDCRLGQGDFQGAMACFEEAHDIYRSQLGEDSNQVARALHHMGVIHCERGELHTAMEAFKTSLKIKQDNGMKNDFDEHTADTLCWIGRVYREQGQPDKARKYFDTARDVKGDFCGADSLEVAEILHNIAVLYDDSGDFERSLRYYRKSLKIRRAALGDQHEDVCDIITCIGNVYKSMGDEHTALKVFRHANELRASVAKATVLNKMQTKTLIHSYEDILDILRLQHKSSERPDVEQDEIASILLKMGQLYDTIDNFAKSDRCFEKSLKLMLTSGDKVKAGQVLNVKGISYAKRQKYKEAMSSFEQALALRKEALGAGHIDVAETLHNMGNCAAKANDLNDARTYYDESLRIKRKRLGSNNTSVAQTLHNIGNVLVGQGKNDAAMRSYQEALSLRRDVLGNDNIEVAYSLHCIAKINRKQHDIEAARDNFNASLRIKRHNLRKNHPSVAETLEQLGSLYMEIGEEDEATLCLNGALNIYKAKHGEGVKVAHVYEQLGAKFERQHNASKAIVYFNKSLRVRARVFGDDHVSVADMHYRIGKLQRDQGSHFEALASFQAATKIRKKIIGRDDLIISDVLTDAGKLQMKLNQVDIADKCFGEALRIRSLILDPRHEKIGECLILNGEVLIAGGKNDEAIGTFNEALSIFQDNSGEFGLLCADAYQHLGTVYKITQEYDKAQDNYEKCLKTRKASNNGEEDIEAAKVNHGLGEVYFALGDYRRAEEYFRDSVEVLVSHLGENHTDVANSVLALGRTCIKLNSPDEATMYFEQAKLTKQHHLGDAHIEVQEISLEIGHVHAMKKEFDEALQYYQAYLRARRAAVGDDVLVCDILLEIGTVESELKRYDEALKSLASALALYRVLLGDEQIQVATTLYNLGVVYEAKRGFKESMKYHKEAFRLRRRLLGPDDLDVANSLDKISGLYMKQPNLEKALHSMKEVLRIRTENLGKEHVDVGASLFGMGVIFAASNDLEKALECYTVSLKIRSAHFGEASVEAAQTLHNMGTVLAEQQDFSSALEHWRRALVAYREAGLSDEDHLVAITIGNVNMAEAYLDDADSKGETNLDF